MSDSLIQRRSDIGGETRELHGNALFARILSSRGVVSSDELDLGFGGLLPPSGLKGIHEAAELLASAMSSQNRILVVGDFDADGATSVTLFVSCMRAFGYEVQYLVPNRFDYGYGLTPEIVDVAAQYQPDVIVTVDNGIASHAGVDLAKSKGWQVLVTDHHLPADTLPNADVIVNPNQPGCAFQSKALAGVGVIFYVMLALRASLREQGWFQAKGIVQPNLAEFLDLVALGSVADVVPLDRNNRILVEQGLRRMRSGIMRPGIQALLEVAKKSWRNLVAQDLGFALGPRINAAGRLDDISVGIRCLLSNDSLEARELANRLDEFNRERRVIEQSMKADAQALLTELPAFEAGDIPAAITLYNASWHQGVVGILASRIKEQYNRPVIVFANDTDQYLKGSARSIEGVHIRDVLDSVATLNPGLICKFGGHAMAAGLTIPSSALKPFGQALEEFLAKHTAPELFHPVKLSDGALDECDFSLEVAQELRVLQPWGQQFPEPLFDNELRIIELRVLSGQHAKMRLQLASSEALLDAIAFNVDLDFYQANLGETLRFLYRLDVNEFRGLKSLQLIIEYAETPLAHSL